MDIDWKNRIDQLAECGLNAWGIAPGESWSEVLPGCRSVVVFASGGSQLWNALLDDIQRNPRGLSDEDHPLDAFVARSILKVDPKPDPNPESDS